MLALFGSFFNQLLARFSDLINSNLCVTKIYWTKSSFPSKSDFKADEDKNKHLQTLPCKGIVKDSHIVVDNYE